MKNIVQKSVETFGKPFSFEDLLQNIFALDYTGNKDTWENDYHGWLADLDKEEYIGYGNELYNLLTK